VKGIELIRSKRASNIIIENSLLDKALVLDLPLDFYNNGYKIHALLSVNGEKLLEEADAEKANEEISMVQSRGPSFKYGEDTLVYYMYTRTLKTCGG